MNVIIASLNTAIERLLLVESQRPGKVHRLLDDKTLAGGKGVNVARVLLQLRQHLDKAPAPLLVGFLGGATGRLCRELLAQEKLPGRWCETAASTRICEVVTELVSPQSASVYNATGPEVRKEELFRLHEMLAEEMEQALRRYLYRLAGEKHHAGRVWPLDNPCEKPGGANPAGYARNGAAAVRRSLAGHHKNQPR
ncbi:hypothetical protein [Dryocola sp. BD586]|uniref:hypothetical protein n=1 Tax=Dryocola sp. BD586 TaxID=3133271 RepID=UPI003F4F40B0